MSGERFTEGELFVYVNGDRWELGMVKRPNNTGDGYFCWYSTGDTAANTPVDHMHKLENHGFTKMEGLLRAATSVSDATGERQGAGTRRKVYLVETSDDLIESWHPVGVYLHREAAEDCAESLRGEYDGIRQFARVVELKVVDA